MMVYFIDAYMPPSASRFVWKNKHDLFCGVQIDCTIEVWEWISIFIQHIITGWITYPCWDLKLIYVSKKTLGAVSK